MSDGTERVELSEELMAIARDAAAADLHDIAVRIAHLALRCNPSRSALTFFADRAASSGDAEEVIRLYRHMIDVMGVPMDAQIAQALGFAEAERGNFREALNYFWRVAALRGHDDHLWFLIASCYAMRREFVVANQIFLRNIVLPLADGRSTSTAILRLPDGPDAIRAVTLEELPFRREFTLNPESLTRDAIKDAEAIYLVCCDSRYFSLFGRALVRSVELRSGRRLALHFHIVNGGGSDNALAEDLRRNSGLPIVYTTEAVDFRKLTPEQIRAYYTCARFLLLPELQTLYGKLILVTDADQTVIRPLDRFLENARGHDVGVLLFPRARYNILALISASVCVANATPGAARFFAAVRAYITERMTDQAGLAWHLDQAALAAAYLACSDVDVWSIPPRNMISKAVPDADEDALFWSVTYSIKSNAAKLDSLEFQQWSDPSNSDS